MQRDQSDFLVWTVGYATSVLAAGLILSVPLHFNAQLGWRSSTASAIQGTLVVIGFVAAFALWPAMRARDQLRGLANATSQYVKRAMQVAGSVGIVVGVASSLSASNATDHPSTLFLGGVILLTVCVFVFAGFVGGLIFGEIARRVDARATRL